MLKKIKNLYFKMIQMMRRARLKNKNFTIISNNCCAGIIYHDLGERFNSPTINLSFINPKDYILFLENLKNCLYADLNDISDMAGEKYPVGEIYIAGKNIRIDFMHYKSFEEASNKWKERWERVDFDNLFVMMEAGIETTDEIVYQFENLPFKNKVIITNKPYSDCPHAFFIDIYGEGYNYGKLITHIPKTLKMKRYLDRFDYVTWLNGNSSV